MAGVISFTKVSLPYGWMGNMSPFPITYEGKEWRTSEALFQALRFEDEEIQEAIRAEKSPMGAKFKAKANRDSMIIVPQSKEDVDNMKLCIRLKIDQHRSLMESLINTGDAPIYEDVTSRPHGSGKFWGAESVNGNWLGENVLGRIWMDIRNDVNF